eukprot:gene30514-39768_t
MSLPVGVAKELGQVAQMMNIAVAPPSLSVGAVLEVEEEPEELQEKELLLADEESSELVTNTVSAVTTENFASLDMKGILGEALYKLSTSMGINVTDDLTQSEESKKDIQAIMQLNLKEVASNLKQLDEESAQLFERLGNLRTELQQETVEFEEKKQEELDELLLRQSQMKVEYSASQAYLQESTDKLQRIMADVTENADIITSLALFPIKTTDQKLAFVAGLSLLFKVPYDLWHSLIQLRDYDQATLTSLLLQAAVGVACFHHYGLVRAAFNTIKKRQ